MNEFLTPKAKNRIWEIPLLVFLIMFAAGGISVMMDDLSAKPGDVGVDLFLLFLFIYPAFRIIRRRIRVGEAGKIAGALSAVQDDRITFARLQQETGMKGPVEKKLRDLMNRKFLKGLEISYSEDLVRLTTAERIRKRLEEESTTFVAECESCGAKKIVKRGVRAKCEYCGSPLKTDK